MANLNDTISDNSDFRKKGLALSETFSLLEGRRPRILIGRGVNALSASMNKICNTFADMGFDVDIAPKLRSLERLATQSLENDANIILICFDQCVSSATLMEFQKIVLTQQTDMILSVFIEETNCISTLEKHLDQWFIFDANTNLYAMGHHLLCNLLPST